MLADDTPRRDAVLAENAPHPRSEELLECILAANQELVESFRIFDDLQTMAQERALELEAEERSKVETRLDRTVSIHCFPYFSRY
jgi:hypothetical protein